MFSTKNAAMSEEIVKKRGSAEARFFRNPDAVRFGHRRPCRGFGFQSMDRGKKVNGRHGRLTLTKSAAKDGTRDQTNCTRESPHCGKNTAKLVVRWNSALRLRNGPTRPSSRRDTSTATAKSGSDAPPVTTSFPSAFAMTAMSVWSADRAAARAPAQSLTI